MRRGACGWLALGILFWWVGGQTAVAEDTHRTADRGFRNYTREAATVAPGQLRIEVRGLRIEDEPDPQLSVIGFPVDDEAVEGIKGGTIDLLASYGFGQLAEVGFDLPFVVQKTRLADAASVNEEDVGDLMLYGKTNRRVAENCSVAGGLELSLPTGADDKGFGTDEVGMNPFLSTRYDRGPFSAGVQIGYRVFTGDVDDVLNYGFTGTLRATDTYSLRIEIAGRLFETDGTEYHDVAILPGIDVRISEAFTIRPTGFAQITRDAMDWGLGLGLALIL